jgi:DNA modification methylase
MSVATDRDAVLPRELRSLRDPRKDIPRIAKDPKLMARIEQAVARVPTAHRLFHRDARAMRELEENSVHLVLTSPPYWTLKDYPPGEGQLGHVADYETFLVALDTVWQQCWDALVPGGRLLCVVGDVCLARRKNGGRHAVVPLHASIQEHCRIMGFDNLAPILWHKIANAQFEAEGNGAACLGTPYEPNAVIKNDIEFILMERKPGGYRSPDLAMRVLSILSDANHKAWFQQIWTGLPGARARNHPAPYPLALAERLVRMFSFVGDTVLDPFLGTGTTTLASALWGRQSLGYEIDPAYFQLAVNRVRHETQNAHRNATIETASTASTGETHGP